MRNCLDKILKIDNEKARLILKIRKVTTEVPSGHHHRKGKGTRRRHTAVQAPEVDTIPPGVPATPAGRAHHGHRTHASTTTPRW